jgi:quercetin dioxygenase-like cupin family protein
MNQRQGKAERMRIVRAMDIKPVSGEEGIMRPLASAPYGLLVHLELTPGKEVPPHSHGHGWMLFCLEGEVELLSADGNERVPAGSAAAVDAAEEVGMRNPHQEPARVLVFSPPTFASVRGASQRVQVTKHHHDHEHGREHEHEH